MTSLLIKISQNRYKDNPRKGIGILSGVVGIICNILLSAVKLVIGLLSNCISITADSVNNLSDAAVNVVTILGTKLSNKPDDKEHPFGHGRIEYISALIVAFSIFFVSYELLRSSIDKIITPEKVGYSVWYILILTAAILVKLWMAIFNHRLYKLTGNLNLKAVRQDSLNDCIATTATAAALIASGMFGISRVDGIIGVCVAVFIFISGIQIVREILNPLLGQAPSREITCKIEELILNDENILGVHDLIVHSYGSNRIIASAHAEVPSVFDLVTIHSIIDNIENEIKDKLGIIMCIHIDPVEGGRERAEYFAVTKEILKNVNSEYSFHDFRYEKNGDNVELSFDVVVPFEKNFDSDKILSELTNAFAEKAPKVKLKVTVEHPYT